ncbi:MAG TPA: glycosyltransferase family 4 protein [Solirubrobacteraceae bacterium]|nr:glycosyltransferase family 4 protein [Solirubrobacteraceae bacterium]
MILFLHNRYRTTGGEERVVEDLLWLVREQLSEDAQLLMRDSATIGRGAAATGLLGGGLAPERVATAVRRSGARIVHAHNLNPSLGWRALAAARAAGARTVLHLHNYRLVCAVGTCFTRGEECTRCHGRDTLPGVRRNCRGTGVEAAVYGASLALWQRRLLAHADAVVVPSAFALARLRALGAPLDGQVHVIGHVVRDVVATSTAATGEYALVVSRLAPEKGVDIAIAACAAAGLPLVIAGDGPDRGALEARAAGTRTTFTGRVDACELARLRAGAGLAIVPSRSAETFGLAAAEAMAAGLPVVASAIGALPELCDPAELVMPGDAAAFAVAVRSRFADAHAGERGRRRVLELAAPAVVAATLGAVYDSL